MNLRQGQGKKEDEKKEKEKEFLIEFDKEMKNRSVQDEGNLLSSSAGDGYGLR